MEFSISCYSTKAELATYAKLNNLSLTYLRHCQVAYLYHVEKIVRRKIAEITGYATSTLTRLKDEVLVHVEKSKEFFFSSMSTVIQPIKETVAITTHKISTKTKNRKCGDVNVKMRFLADCGEDIPDTQQVYLFKFYTSCEALPIFSKIGTTAKSAEKRLRQEIGEYRKKGFDVQSVDVCKIIPCGDMPAESYESYLRAFLIKDYPKTWKRNDRFFNVDISTERFTELCKKFKAI